MAVIWKHNGVVVSGSDAIPKRHGWREGVAVRASYKKPIALQSMGFLADPADVAEHRRQHPGVELRMMEGSAVPVVHSLGEKRAYLRDSGWIDKNSY